MASLEGVVFGRAMSAAGDLADLDVEAVVVFHARRWWGRGEAEMAGSTYLGAKTPMLVGLSEANRSGGGSTYLGAKTPMLVGLFGIGPVGGLCTPFENFKGKRVKQPEERHSTHRRRARGCHSFREKPIECRCLQPIWCGVVTIRMPE